MSPLPSLKKSGSVEVQVPKNWGLYWMRSALLKVVTIVAGSICMKTYSAPFFLRRRSSVVRSTVLGGNSSMDTMLIPFAFAYSWLGLWMERP